MNIKLKTTFTKATFTKEEFLSSHDEVIKDFEDYVNGSVYSEDELKAKFLEYLSWIIYPLDLYYLEPNEEINDSNDPEILNWDEVLPSIEYLISHNPRPETTIHIIITADMNDGDFVTKVSQITSDELAIIKPVIKVLNENRGRWGTLEMIENDNDPVKIYKGKLSTHQIDLFNQFVPTGDSNYPGVHTIESVKIVNVVEDLL